LPNIVAGHFSRSEGRSGAGSGLGIGLRTASDVRGTARRRHRPAQL